MQIQIRGNYMLFHGDALKAHPGLNNVRPTLFQIGELFSQASQAENAYFYFG